jgi:hypothetical protein
VDQYRVYLRAELGKLANVDDGRAFVEKSGCRVEEFRLVADPVWLAQSFGSQRQVDAYVDVLDDLDLVRLTQCCDSWRGNGIAGKLSRRQIPTCIEVRVGDVLLNQAEPWLGHVFRQHDGRLAAIAQDQRVLGADAYSRHRPGEEISYRVCLANPVRNAEGTYRVFDGMHRAIQMVRNGDAQIPLCVVGDP